MAIPDNPHDRHLWQFRWVRDLIVFTCAIFVLWLGYRVGVVTVPLLLALTAAYLCEPLVAGLARRVPRLGRTGAAFTLLSGLVLSILALGALIMVPVTKQAAQLIQDAPRLLAQAEDYLTDEERPAWLRERLEPIVTSVTALVTPVSSTAPEPHHAAAMLDQPVPQPLPDEAAPTTTIPEMDKAPPIADPIRDIISKAAHFLGDTTEMIFGIVLFVTIFLFAFVPLSASFPAVAHWTHDLVPAPLRSKAEPLLQRMDLIISGFVRGRLITAGLLAVIYAIGWSLVGVPYAAVIGILTGLVSLIPYASALGLPIAWMLVATAAIGATEPGFYVASEGDTLSPIWWKILLLPAIVNVIAQVLEDYVLNPLIQGKATHLHPLVILLAIIAGGSLLGLYGMILAVPIAACAKVLLDAVVAPALRTWAEHASAAEIEPDGKSSPSQ